MKNTDGFDASILHRSVSCNVFDHLGAHKKNNRIVFRTWAPNADEVLLVGDFNSWSHSHPMKRITEGGIWECTADLDSVRNAPLYKYKIRRGERVIYKADPFGRMMQTPPDTATVWYDADAPFPWTDNGWMKIQRHAFASRPESQPMNVYEVHLGSFLRHADGSYLNYREIAPRLASYLKKMSYTHVELLPVSEHHFDHSLGYDVSGFYSVNSRHGTPDDLKYLVNTLHNAGLGVIFDISISHIPCDEHGLFQFDGERSYESSLSSSDGSKRYFDLSKTEVRSFLISNACYYARDLHADGIRISDLRSTLYLDYGKSKDEWTPNRHGGNVNFEAAAFIKQLNGSVKRLYPDVVMISDGCCKASDGGCPEADLGFDLLTTSSHLNAAGSLLKPQTSLQAYKKMSDAVCSKEKKRILSLSQRDLSLSTRSLMDRTEGSYEERFAQLRAFFTYCMTIPGKKLSFMSNEYGQFAPWDHAASLEWFMLDFDMHRRLRDYNADLGALYLGSPALWELDSESEGRAMISPENSEQGILAYTRTDKRGMVIYVILNLTSRPVRVSSLNAKNGSYRILISSAYEKYGGHRSELEISAAVTSGTLDRELLPFESILLEANE